MADQVDKAFEARVISNLDQHEAAIERLYLQGMGILLAISLLGIAVALVGKELSK
jgi:hypothetical protein